MIEMKRMRAGTASTIPAMEMTDTRRLFKDNPDGVIPSTARRRISREKLSAIYRMDRGTSKIIDAMQVTIEEIEDVPDSMGMRFSDWYDLCRKTMDVYEEEQA